MPHFLSPMVARPGEAFHLVNERTDRIVASTLEHAFDSRARRKGLLSRSGLAPGTAIVLAPCAAVHTLFMRFAIDVLFVGRDGTIARICHGVRPWRIAASWRAFAVVELAAGAAQATQTAVGDTLRLAAVENLPPARLQSGRCEPASIESERAR